ncbi:hypothetical protein AZI86_12675 [Bdellovibrio bacteriovorus]|uniref:histidine kinase n=1 Tax=Bdellovibrio bacteriovorus TaxID=959 RepID=A0A150WIT3_BDEBC|nr:response regulator [Bdellovibrio bacteriovorus]KYG63678.1 hypothetical protein AZI86_12675 [Bdellovibrio bacteriovorus]
MEIKKQYKPLIALGLVLSLLAIKVWFLRSSFQAVEEQQNWVSHTVKVQNELELAISSCKDAQTGIRGFLLTKNQNHIALYEQGTSQALYHIDRVIDLSKDNPSQQDAARSVEQSFKRYFEKLEVLKKLRSLGDGAALNLALSETQGVMDVIRRQVNEMIDKEQVLLDQRMDAAANQKQYFYWTLYASNIFLATVLAAAFFQISTNMLRATKEAEKKEIENHRKSILSSMAQAVAEDHSPETAGEAILKELERFFGIVAGKVYVIEGAQLAEVASHGASNTESQKWDRHKGLLGSALEKSHLTQLSDVPANYWKISSGLGEMPPKALVLVPFSFQEKKMGIVEMAVKEFFTAEQIETVQSLTETMGVGMSSALSKKQLEALLDKTQQQSAELQAQQEELRASNEELEQQARALESQQQALNIKNKELESTQSQLELRAQDLERSTQYKSEFLAKMSHELRTPLNGLLILSTLLVENKEKNLNDQQKQFAQSINNAGNDLLMLINDILDLSKIEARKLSLKAEDFLLGEMLDSMKLMFEPQTKAKNLDLVIDVSSADRNLNLHTDRQRLEQILRNFLSNALKFTHEGSITLRAVSVDRGQGVDIFVVDTGIGIPAEKQQLIFEAFEQADSSVSRQYGGTGLGLTISRELATLLGGSIKLTSQHQKGSSFSIHIPIILPSSQGDGPAPLMVPDRAVKPRQMPEPDIAKKDENATLIKKQAQEAIKDVGDEKTILVVEDDDAFRTSVVEAIKSYGFKPIQAADGEVALAILKIHVPSAILLDIKLPGISGLGILEMIKQMPHLRHIPVHMISGLEYQQNALRMGALGYLTKPVTIDKVRSAIERIESLISSRVRKVLLIEDDKTQSLAVSELISADDIEVVPAKTGKEAVDLIQQSVFDCIILDLVLPDLSGFDLLEALSKLEISLPPIVIYTGKDLTSQEESYLRKFSESIIIKGVRSPERLLDEVSLFLHRVESLLPAATRELLTQLRSQEKAFEGKTVLIADDDIRNIFALTSALESKGLKVEIARDGVEALSVLDKKPHIDVVLMDIMMPKMDGFEAMRQIRKNPLPRINKIPIIAVTAKAMKEDHEKCIEAGANDYLPKPINLDNLSTILKVWLAPKGLFD